MENKFLIGIDPDVSKSGVAIYYNGKVELNNLSFFELFDYLFRYSYREEVIKPTVFIECGFLNKSNWHAVKGGNSALNSQIGSRTGANHETARKIVEMCIYLGFNHVEVRPTKSKLNAESFKCVTGIMQRTNQEQRDAYMLIFGK